MLENAIWIGLENCELAPWKGKIITMDDINAIKGKYPVENGSIAFRKTFTLQHPVREARLAISGLGYYEVYINGRKPDENCVLAPVFSNYHELVRYNVYDVADLLCAGENVIAVEVGGGWFAMTERWCDWHGMWFGNPRLIAELTLTDAAGVSTAIRTDETWKAAHGSVVWSCIYDGETVDFNRIPGDWNQPGFCDCGWNYALPAEAPTDNLRESVCPPVRIVERLLPVNVQKFSDTEFVYDFGVNGSALPEITVMGQKGDTVQLNFSEFAHADGTLDPTSENRARCTDIYTLSGSGCEVCRPRFTWHGYRYCKVTLSSPDIQIIKFENCVIHSDVKTISSFTCSDPVLNRLHEVYVRTELADLMGVPLDCNQRDERLPWLGDACVTSEMAHYNFDMRAFYESFLEDMRLNRHPEEKFLGIIAPRHRWKEEANNDFTSIDWTLAYPTILLESYARYGDISLLKKHYQALSEHVAYHIAQLENGFIHPCWFGDWFSVDFPGDTKKVVFAPGQEYHRQNPPYLATVFFVRMLRQLAEVASTLGDAENAEKYLAIRQASVDALLARCYDRENATFGGGGQFLLTYTLSEGIIPEEDRERVFHNLVAEFEKTGWHSLMGVIGLREIFDVFRSFGRDDLAYRIMTAEGYPSPRNMIAHGETTLTEGLDGGGSGCHCMFASPDAMFHRILGGITIDRRSAPAISIRPYCPEDMTYVSASQEIGEGIVECAWRRVSGKIAFTVKIPAGCTAQVELKGVKACVSEMLGGGNYNFIL